MDRDVSAFVELAFWTDHETLVVEVADSGSGLADETCRGMWLAWRAADDVASGPTHV